MASFRVGHDEYQHELPWQLMQNGPVTKYMERTGLDEDVAELQRLGFVVRRFSCAEWRSEGEMHTALKAGLELPSYTGKGLDALEDSLTDIDVPEAGGLAIVLDDFTDRESRNTKLIHVLARTSRWWLLFGRIVVVLLRTDDPRYEGPVDLGATPAQWNGREWMTASRMGGGS